MIDIFDMAKYTLYTIDGEISTMKLQKLYYYSQAWYGVPLFQKHFKKGQ
ncbi:MAG: hypothetical protein LBB16_03855 [Puniceicoccales bacterium]|nr:hypothetical protein [Puniceicoccales bacterium]